MPGAQQNSQTNPLIGIERLLVDGNNLLQAMRRGAPAAPAATLVGRLRGVVEMPVRIELVFDGPPDRGLGDTRIASGVTVRYSGRYSADSLLARLVAEAEDASTILVVTDDVDLRHEITRQGGRTAGARWLIGRLERSRLAAPSVGRPKPPIAQPDPGPDDDATPGWRPGRGATTKRGNPKKAPKGAGARPSPARGSSASRSDPHR